MVELVYYNSWQTLTVKGYATGTHANTMYIVSTPSLVHIEVAESTFR